MNKQVEQIRAEIERRLRLLEHGDADIEVMKRVEGVIKGYKAVLSFIDSIPEEPVSEDLDKAIEDAKTEERRRMMRNAINGYIERDMGGQLIVGKTNLGAADEFMLLNSHTFRDVKCGERYNVKLIIIKED